MKHKRPTAKEVTGAVAILLRDALHTEDRLHKIDTTVTTGPDKGTRMVILYGTGETAEALIEIAAENGPDQNLQEMEGRVGI